MSDANTSNSRLKGWLSFIFALFLIGYCSRTAGSGDSPRLAGKFYGYSQPSTKTYGNLTVHVGPAVYEVQFDYGESENTIKVKMQELETLAENGGNWQPALEGTRFTNNGYIDEYAKPIFLYGTYKTNENDKSIIVSGTISTGSYTDPFIFEWVLDKSRLTQDNNIYTIKQLDDLCFELPTSSVDKITVCSTPKYFTTKMIEEIEKNHNIKLTDIRKQDLLSQTYK